MGAANRHNEQISFWSKQRRCCK